MQNLPTKTCVDCNLDLCIDNFYNSKANAGGKSTCCKLCARARNKKAFLNHRESRLDAIRLYKTKNKHRLRTAARERRRKMIASFTEAELTNFRKKRQESKRIHRAKKYGSGGRHSEKEWQELLKICNYKCVRCNVLENLSRDHIVPLALGGSDNISNIQPLCRPCNSSKNKWSTMDYRKKEMLPAIKEIGNKTCPVCNSIFKPRNPKKIYCSKKCSAKKHNSGYRKEWLHKRKQNHVVRAY